MSKLCLIDYPRFFFVERATGLPICEMGVKNEVVIVLAVKDEMENYIEQKSYGNSIYSHWRFVDAPSYIQKTGGMMRE